jgi:hypothetical protein
MKHTSMKRGMAIITLGFCALAMAAAAQAEEWSKTYTLTGEPDLRIDTSDANIHVTTWDQKTIEAKVSATRYKIGDDGIRIEEHQAGDMVEIDVHFPHHGVTINWGIAWISTSECRAKGRWTCIPETEKSNWESSKA